MIPSGQSKLSLKIAGKKEEVKTPAPEAATPAAELASAPEKAPGAAADAPKAENAPKPVIKIALNKPSAADPAAPAAAMSPAAPPPVIMMSIMDIRLFQSAKISKNIHISL